MTGGTVLLMEAEGGLQWTEFGSKEGEAVNVGFLGERMMLFDFMGET